MFRRHGKVIGDCMDKNTIKSRISEIRFCIDKIVEKLDKVEELLDE